METERSTLTMIKPLQEGWEKRGGVNPAPKFPKPNNPPPAMPTGKSVQKIVIEIIVKGSP
jgi:hypothetical protein